MVSRRMARWVDRRQLPPCALCDATLRVICQIQLFWIGTTIEAHCADFAVPDQLGTAETEALPPPLYIFRRTAIFLAIPAFHRLHPKPMSDRHAFEIKRGAQGRARPARDNAVTGHIEARRLNII